MVFITSTSVSLQASTNSGWTLLQDKKGIQVFSKKHKAQSLKHLELLLNLIYH